MASIFNAVYSFLSDEIPGSLLQLLELFVKRLDYEVTVEVNKEMGGTINVFLTEGYYETTDSLRESKSRCGIRIHTHPRYAKDGDDFQIDDFIPPSHGDLGNSLFNLSHARFQHPDEDPRGQLPLPAKISYSREYVFDGKAFWSYQASPALQRLWLKINHESRVFLRDKLSLGWIEAWSRWKHGGDLESFIRENKTLGIDISATLDWRRRTVPIKDSLKCMYERRDRHLTLPNGLLNSSDLEDLYEKAVKVIVRRRLESNPYFEAPFGG